MAKGKYAARATVRREQEEIAQAEEAYKRQIVRLTEERNKARAERDEAVQHWQKEVRILRAQLAEGTSPRVEALTRELNKSREKLGKVESELKSIRKRWERSFRRLADYIRAQRGVSDVEALDIAAQIAGDGDLEALKILTPDESGVAEKHGDDAALTLRKVRRG